MTVKVADTAIQVVIQTFEARFDDGFRFFDSCGKAMSLIRAGDRNWKWREGEFGGLVNRDKKLSCSMDSAKIVVSRASGPPLGKLAADDIAANLGKESARLYGIATDAFEVPNTTRVGIRFSFFATADSVEDAERFVLRVTHSPLFDELERQTSSRGYAAHLRFNLEEESTGYRRSVVIGTAQIEETKAPITGLGGEDEDAKCGVFVDIDTFTRPTQGHFLDTEMFIANAYLRSWNHSRDILHWIARQQKGGAT